MSKEYALDHLDVAAFVKANAVMEGQEPVAAFQRLAKDASASVDGLQVSWRAEGEYVPEMGGTGQLWLHLDVEAELPMQCQRCLGTVLEPLVVERSFRFVKDEATAEALDDEADEDLLALSKDFNLRQLIEDELLMALPFVPMHEHCPEAVPMASSDEDFEAANTEKASPFAVLADLRKNAD